MCVGAQGTLFQQVIATVYTTIALVEKVSPPTTELDIMRCKAIDAEYSKVFAVGSVEGGTADAEIWYDPMDDGHEILMASVHNYQFSGGSGILASDRKKNWRLRFAQLFTTGLVSEPRNWIFIAILKSFNVSLSTGEPLKASLSLEVERSTTLPNAAGAA